MDKRQKEASKYFTIVAIILIPIVSLSLAFKGPIFDLTLSKVGARGDYSLLVLWGTLITTFFFTSIMYLMNFYKIEDKKTKIFLLIACVMIEVTVAIPYLPQTLPVLSSLHNYFAYIGIFSLLISMYFLIMTLNKVSKRVFRITILYFNIIVIVSSIVLFNWGTSSFIEILMVILSSNLLYLVNFLLNKETVKRNTEILYKEKCEAKEIYSVTEAIDLRVSRRSYIGMPINEVQKSYLNNLINDVNKESKLNITLIDDASCCFKSFFKTFGVFSGVKSAIILKGKKDLDNLEEMVGYYGQYLLIKATQIGLSTCWVGSSYKKDKLEKEIDEEIVAIIVVGLAFDVTTSKEDAIIKAMNKKRKKLESFIDSSVKMDDKFMPGIEAVRRAPSNKNVQDVLVSYKDNKIYISTKDNFPLSLVNLGIAKFNFEAFVKGKFERGNDAMFIEE